MAAARDFRPEDHCLASAMIPFLDRHMVLPLLQFLGDKKVFDEKSILKAKYDLVRKTNMIDLFTELHKAINQTDEVPEAIKTQRANVIKQISTMKAPCGPLFAMIDQEEEGRAALRDRLADRGAAEHLAGQGVTQEHVAALQAYAKFKYSIGFYTDAAWYLYVVRRLTQDRETAFSALWGKLAAEIVYAEWEDALKDLKELHEEVNRRAQEGRGTQLANRRWLLHWALFVFNAKENGPSEYLDWLFQDQRMLNTIQNCCPYFLRYVAAFFVVTNRTRRERKELLYVLQEERHTYSDPVTEVLLNLFVDFDFDAASKNIQSAKAVLEQDFFLAGIAQSFLRKTKLLLFQTVCQIHQRVGITKLLERLQLCEEDFPQEKAAEEAKKEEDVPEDPRTAEEKRIVALLRETQIKAKINSEDNCLEIVAQHPTVYEQVIDKTKELSVRADEMASKLSTRLRELADTF